MDAMKKDMVQAVLEQLKKDKTRKGLKEMIVKKLIEYVEFEYSCRDAFLEKMTKIKDFVNENKWSKTAKMINEFEQMKHKVEESNKEFITKFGTMKVKMKNADINLPATWMVVELC